MTENNSKKSYKFAKIIFSIFSIGIILLSLLVFEYSLISKNPTDNLNQYEQAMQGEEPFVALFYSKWCGYCERFMPTFSYLSETYKGKYRFVLIDTDDEANRSKIIDYRVSGLPTVYIIDPKINNRILLNNAILENKNDLRTELDRYLRIRSLIPNLNKI